jgi:hypothetical protein
VKRRTLRRMQPRANCTDDPAQWRTKMKITDKLMDALLDCIMSADEEDQEALHAAYDEYCFVNRNARQFPLRTKLCNAIDEALEMIEEAKIECGKPTQRFTNKAWVDEQR